VSDSSLHDKPAIKAAIRLMTAIDKAIPKWLTN
jgi:hypothetical protein